MPKSDVLTEKEDAKVMRLSFLGDSSWHSDGFGDPMHREFTSELNGLRLVAEGGLVKVGDFPFKTCFGILVTLDIVFVKVLFH